MIHRSPIKVNTENGHPGGSAGVPQRGAARLYFPDTAAAFLFRVVTLFLFTVLEPHIDEDMNSRLFFERSK